MNCKSWLKGFALLVVMLVLSGCGTPPPPDKVACSIDEIRMGDTLVIAFSDLPPGAEKPEVRVKVKDDGTVTMPLLGSVAVARKKMGTVEVELQKKYVPAFYKQLTITVKAEDRFYTVGGEVKGPG